MKADNASPAAPTLFLKRRLRKIQIMCGVLIAEPERTWRAHELVRATGLGASGFLLVVQMDRHGWVQIDTPPEQAGLRVTPTPEGLNQMRAFLIEGVYYSRAQRKAMAQRLPAA